MDEPNETLCIRDMCCNQFGERDEMQSIINSLQADVIARGARITDLEREVERLGQAPTIKDYIANMTNIQNEASLKGENGMSQMASFAIKTAEAYLLLRERDE